MLQPLKSKYQNKSQPIADAMAGYLTGKQEKQEKKV